MAVATLGNLLDKTIAFEERLEDYYQETLGSTTDEGVRLLTPYLSKHRKRLARVADAIPPRLVAEACAEELPDDVELDHESEFQALSVPPAEIAAPVLLESAISYATAITDAYRTVLKGSRSEPARELLGNLITHEEHDIALLRNIESMNYF